MTKQFKQYAIIGMRNSIDLDWHKHLLGEDFEFVNLSQLKETLQDLAEEKGTYVGSFDIGYYDSDRTEWYACYSEFFSTLVEDNDEEAWRWFEGVDLPGLMGDCEEPSSYRYSDKPKGQII